MHMFLSLLAHGSPLSRYHLRVGEGGLPPPVSMGLRHQPRAHGIDSLVKFREKEWPQLRPLVRLTPGGYGWPGECCRKAGIIELN
jgi:hypothetical protein